MSKIIKIDKTLNINSFLRYLFVLFFVISISLWISTIILFNREKSSNIDYFDSTVDSVIFDEEENHYLIKLTEYEYIFKID